MTTTTTLLRRLTAVIARGSAIWRCALMNRGGSDIVPRWNRQPVSVNKLNRLHDDKNWRKSKLRHALSVLVRPRRSADFRPEAVHFLNDELLHAFDRVLLFKEEVEFLTGVDRTPVCLLSDNEKKTDHAHLGRQARQSDRARRLGTDAAVPVHR